VTLVLDIIIVLIVLIGVVVLLYSLVPINSLIREVPPGVIVNKWLLMRRLILLFAGSYIAYAYISWKYIASTGIDLLVPAVFLFGSLFVWISAQLSLQTANDIRRVALLERETITDPLMNIYNRRYMDERLSDEVARSQRYGLPLSVLLLDIDHFKNVNDHYGHQAGDEALKFLGKLILSAVRESDLVTRYGGEEILVITPNTPEKSALVLAERLRKYVESRELVLANERGGRRAIKLTVSVGVSSVSGQDFSAAQLISQVDKALYQAKEQGRNRVVSDSSVMLQEAAV